MNDNQPKAYRKDGKLVIELPEDNLIFAAENSPHWNVKITDRDAYLKGIMDSLFEYSSGTDDEPALFRVIDEITEDLIESAEPGIELIDDESN